MIKYRNKAEKFTALQRDKKAVHLLKFMSGKGGLTVTEDEKYFVSLISSHLNGKEPPLPDDNISWERIYSLSTAHNTAAIIADCIGKLPQESRPDAKLCSAFRQQLGYTLINFEQKIRAYNYIKSLLDECKSEYIFVKGIVLGELYPVREYRTSGDIDVLVRDESLEGIRAFLKKNSVVIKEEDASYINAECFGVPIEIQSVLYGDSDFSKTLFDISQRNGFEYTLSPEAHLIYVLCHIVKHFNICGAGIRMFMDVDVLLRHLESDGSCDYEKICSVCEELNILNFTKYTFSLCRSWFSSPTDTVFDIEADENIMKMFEEEILGGGSFGFEKRGIASYYLSQGIGKSGKNNFASKLRALLALLFPKKEYLYSSFEYAKKHHFLLGAAWVERIFKAVFVRGGHSLGTVSSILGSDEKSAQYKKLLNELEI